MKEFSGKKLPALLLTLCLTLGLVPTAKAEELLISPAPTLEETWLVSKVKTYDGRFQDDDAWCADAMQTVYEAGLMEGKTAFRFDITSALTNAQITVISARLHALLNGGDGVLPTPAEGEAWYQPAADYLKTQSDDENLLYLLKQLEKAEGYPDASCTRLNFVRMLAVVLPDDALTTINTAVCVPDSSDTQVLTFYEAGILNGSNAYGTFGESTSLTRGAAAAILARIVDPEQRLTFTLKSFDLCRDVLGVEPETILLTVNGEEIPAELFAEQLCTSLYQWEGDAKSARKDAIQFWCQYQGSFRVLAKDLGIFLSAEESANIQEHAADKDGYLGLPAAYWQFREEGTLLNLTMRNYYYQYDNKTGESGYHSALEQTAAQLIRTAVPAPALESMDLQAVYQRLMNSPFVQWQFN